jgi:hypothetical protein
MDEWTFEAATWIATVAEARQDPALRGDTALVTSRARDVLETTPYVPKAEPVPYGSTDDATEYARMLDRDDLPEDND